MTIYFGWIHNFNMCKWKVTRFSRGYFCALPLASDISSSYFYYITNLKDISLDSNTVRFHQRDVMLKPECNVTSSGNASGSYAFGTRLMITRAYTCRLASKSVFFYFGSKNVDFLTIKYFTW